MIRTSRALLGGHGPFKYPYPKYVMVSLSFNFFNNPMFAFKLTHYLKHCFNSNPDITLFIFGIVAYSWCIHAQVNIISCVRDNANCTEIFFTANLWWRDVISKGMRSSVLVACGLMKLKVLLKSHDATLNFFDYFFRIRCTFTVAFLFYVYVCISHLFY